MTTPYFDFITGLISAAKTRADKLALHAEHHGLAGEMRELATEECVKPFLTQSFLCGTGKIIDSLGNTSDQTDIVVFHKKTVAPVFYSSNRGFYPVECVKYVFEVKSTLSATEIKDANTKFRTLAKLKSYPVRDENGTLIGGPMPIKVLFAFSSDIVGNELDRYLKHTEDSVPPCNVLCVLGKGYWWYNNGKWEGIQCLPNTPPFVEYALFITGVMNTLSEEECSTRPFKPGPYVDALEPVIDALGPKLGDVQPDLLNLDPEQLMNMAFKSAADTLGLKVDDNPLDLLKLNAK